MGVSTDGSICFGYLFEEEYKFPWDEGPWYGDYEEWWGYINGFVPSFYPYDEHGEYKEGVDRNDSRVDQYYKEKSVWKKENPFPIELVNVCSCDYPIQILAVKESYVNCSRGYPTKLDFSKLMGSVSMPEISVLLQFCKKAGIDTEEMELCWYLGSLWC